MNVLGIETSCDDTSAAVYNGRSLLSNVVSTQLVHRQFGGVVPELASRSHIRLIVPILKQALSDAGIGLKEIDGIAVTYGPGLAGSLLVGMSLAKGLAISMGRPFIGINHLEGHVWANQHRKNSDQPPFIVLVVSGGHTQLVQVEEWGRYRLLGRTRDDAAGEAFDKVGKLLKVGYPGGPAIERIAKKGNPAYTHFPRAYLEEGCVDFSFSGLKTAVLNHVNTLGPEQMIDRVPDIAASFQAAVVDVLVEKTRTAARRAGIDRVCLAGGVAVNRSLRGAMTSRLSEDDITVSWPPPQMCTDNAGMIAIAGHYYLERGQRSTLSLSPAPSLNM